MKRKADIRQEVINDVCYVFVLDKRGKECFRQIKAEQSIAIAHAIYMYEKYDDIQALRLVGFAA